MLGVVKWTGERKVVLERVNLLEMPVLQVSVSPDGRRAAHRLRRAGRLLIRNGVRRVLVPPGFDEWRELSRLGLRGVDPLLLYRAMADRLAIAELERRGVGKVRACVALRGVCPDAELTRAAWLLCPRVRAVIVQVEWGGERLAQELYREFGVVAPPGAKGDVAVRFSGKGDSGELVLCGQPELLGLGVEPVGVTLPEGVEPLPLLTALWQTGRLSLDELRVVDVDFS